MTPSVTIPLTSNACVGEEKPFLVTVVCFASAALHGMQGGLPRRCATRNDGVCLAMKAFRHATAHGLWLPTCRVAFQMCRVCGGACCRGRGPFLRDEMMLFTTQCGFFYFYPLLLAEHI